MPYHCYFNHEYHPIDTPLLKTDDLGLLRGYSLFDYFRTYNGIPFRFDDYWDRFTRSAEALGLEVPVSRAGGLEIVQQLYRLSDQADIAFRLVLTGGYAADGLTVLAPNFLVRSEPLPRDNPEGRERGIKVIPYEYVRDLPYVKTTSYIHMMLMAPEFKRQGAADLLFHKNGLVSELTRSNLFIVKDGRLVTPDRDALRGITRNRIIEIAGAHYPVEQRDVSLVELLAADEVFTTSTTKWVMPIVHVGESTIGTGIPGKVTLKLLDLLEDEFRHYGAAT